MSVFGAYARYYDLLYRDKDYSAETDYIRELFRRHDARPSSILELGCGTGAHAMALAAEGYAVHGVDASAEMLDRARQRWTAVPAGQPRPQGMVGDLRNIRIDARFDAVLALFHVFSYLPENADLQAGVATAAAHLAPGGLLVLDFWYGPGVLTDPPTVRRREMSDKDILVRRQATPHLMTDRNLVDVCYHIEVEDRASGNTEILEERHRMRYLFQPELRSLLEDGGFDWLACYEWLTDKPPTAETWNAAVVARYRGAG